MINPEDRVLVKNVVLSDNMSPIPLPDGKQQIPLGSGVTTKLLGQGGMAAVYEIWNQQLEMYRAIKIINPGAAETARQRFQTEIKISAKLQHPNIIEIHGVGEWHGLPYIEMEKIDGIGLDVLIAERGSMPAVVCTAIGIMICRALNYAHNQDCSIYGKNYRGVIHRDLKPANIMVSTSGVVKLMDFGIARPADVSFQTMDGLVAGTLQYLAPEQLEKKKLDFTTDIYALGVTLYEIITGRVAFPQSNLTKLIADKSRNWYKPLNDFNLKIPPKLRKLIQKCMHVDPSKRVLSAIVLQAELQKLHSRLTTKTPEEIMASMAVMEKGEKVIIATRIRFPFKTIAALLIVAAVGYGVYVKYWPTISTYFQPSQVKPSLPTQTQPFTQQQRIKTVQSYHTLPQIHEQSREKKTSSVKKTNKQVVTKSAISHTIKSIKSRSLAETLQEKYGTTDLLAIMEKEFQAKSYQNVLTLFDALPKNLAKSTQASMLKLQTLNKAKLNDQLSQFIDKNDIQDGQFVLEKAKLAFRTKNYKGCKKLLTQSLTLPHAFMDYDILKQEVYYYTAQCMTAEFDGNPNEKSYKDALDAWWQLRTALRANPDHEYNKKAILELQRMAQKMQKG
jgi:serine/threonine protein kinase